MSEHNELKLLSEFQAVLANYQPSASASELLKQVHLVLFTSPFSSGKNSIIGKLMESGKYHAIVSDTTRHPRTNNGVKEQNGREYWFRSEAEILNDLKAGDFLEAAIIHNQQVSGTSMRELAASVKEHKTALHEVDIQGVDIIQRLKPDTLCLFILAPNFDEWLVRINSRGQLPETELKRRFESSVIEFETALSHDYYRFVVNDTFARTAQLVDDIIDGRQTADQARGRQVAEELLADTQRYLSSLT